MGPPGGRRGKQGQNKKEMSSGSGSGKTQQRQHHNDKRTGESGNRHTSGRNNANLKKRESESIPVELQQLLLNVFRSAFWRPTASLESPTTPSLSQNIQTLKDHLYRRDFVSAFADANDELLKAYALRWSAARALGYSEILWRLRDILLLPDESQSSIPSAQPGVCKHVVCIGGGGGAEVVALAAVRRALDVQSQAGDTAGRGDQDVSSNLPRMSELSVSESENKQRNVASESANTLFVEESNTSSGRQTPPDISVTAIDIADWSSVLTSLTSSLCDESVPAKKAFPSPLLRQASYASEEAPFAVDFRNADILKASEGELQSHLLPLSQVRRAEIALVTLMFTLNELFSTSMSQTVRFLLRLTDIVQVGTVLLVVDSPGSYSTVSLGASTASPKSTARNPTSPQGEEEEEEEEEANSSSRKYPMRFLLEHTLLSVAAGKWECVLSDESRWFRRDKNTLNYDLGDGIRLEDMRYQIHVYKKIA